MEYNRPAGRFGLYAVMIALILMGYLFLSKQTDTQSNYTLEQMQTALKEGKVLQAAIRPNREVPTGTVVVYISEEGQKRFYATDVTKVEQILRDGGVSPVVEDVPADNSLWSALLPVLLSGVMIIILFTLMNRSMAGSSSSNNRMMNFGKSRARMSSPDDKKITFKDVAGLLEEKEDLVEVVDFLRAPQKYT